MRDLFASTGSQFVPELELQLTVIINSSERNVQVVKFKRLVSSKNTDITNLFIGEAETREFEFIPAGFSFSLAFVRNIL